MDFCLVDEKNIKKFLEIGGKFLFTDTNYKDYTFSECMFKKYKF